MPKTNEKQTIRAAAILTTSYVASDPVDGGNSSLVTFYFTYTKGSLTNLKLQFERSADGVAWFPVTAVKYADPVSGAVAATLGVVEYTYEGTGNFEVSLGCGGEQLRVQAKGTGTVTGSSLAIQVQEANPGA